MKSDFNLGKHIPASGWAAILLSVAVVYFVVCMLGFKHYINFFPSSQWTTISMGLSVVSGLVCSAFAIFMFQPPDDNVNTPGIGMKTALGAVAFISLCSLSVYNLLSYGLGPAVTVFSYTTIEKNITGTKVYKHGNSGRGSTPDEYYIDTSDLPEGDFAKLYITENEFDSIHHDDVYMHITLKQSFFGMAVEYYTFLPSNPKVTKSPTKFLK